MHKNIHEKPSFYDELTATEFQELCRSLVRKTFGEKGFISGPVKGADGGKDSSYLNLEEGIKKLPYSQIKFHQIINYGLPKVRSKVLSEFNNWTNGHVLAQTSRERRETIFLFITNVSLTKKFYDKFSKICEENKGKAEINFWSFSELTNRLMENKNLIETYFPDYTRQRTVKIEKENIQLRNNLEKQELQAKIRKLFIDVELQTRYYHGFVYLLSPFSIKKDTKVIAELFDLDNAEQEIILKNLKKQKLISITGDLFIPTKIEQAKDSLREMIGRLKISLSELIKVLS